MRLHEEYIVRNNLNVPIVRYEPSQAILRSKDPPYCWRILSANWRSVGYHPGFFEITCKMPIHNGYYKNRMLGDVIRPRSVSWDSYEGCILDVVDSQKRQFEAIPLEQYDFAAWVMFLFIYDNWLASNMDSQFFDCVYEALEQNESSLENARNLLAIKDFDMNETFEYQVKPLTYLKSEWLKDLVND